MRSLHRITAIALLALVLAVLVGLVGEVGAETTTIINVSNDARMSYEVHNSTFIGVRSAQNATNVLNNPTDRVYGGWLQSDIQSNSYWINYRSAINIPTYLIPNNKTQIIRSAILSMPGAAKSNTLGTNSASIVDLSPIVSHAFNTPDYSKTTFTKVAPDISYASFLSNGLNNFTINVTKINPFGNTSFLLINSNDADNTSPSWVISSGQYFYYNSTRNPVGPNPSIKITTGDPEKIIVSVGDSLTQGSYSVYQFLHGYGGYIKVKQPNWSIINSGASGMDTQYNINHYSADVAAWNISTIPASIIFENGNDIQNGLTLNDTIARYLQFEAMSSANGTTVYFNTIPPRTGIYAYNSTQNAIRLQLNDWVRYNFSQNHQNRYYIDLSYHLTDPTNASQMVPAYTYDGTHLNDLGYYVWGNAIDTNFPSFPNITTTISPPGPISIYYPNGIAFTDASTGFPIDWDWSFGDGTESDLQNPTHYWASPGTYTVTLNVTDGFDYSTNSTTVTVDSNDFTATPTSGGTPLSVSFTDLSTTSTSWAWNFGDGAGVSPLQNPTHVYTQSGYHTVTRTVSNGMDTGTIQKVNYIDVAMLPGPGGSRTTGGTCSYISGAFYMLGLAIMAIGIFIVASITRSVPLFKQMYREGNESSNSVILFAGIGVIIGGAILLAVGIMIVDPIVLVTGC